MKSESEVTQSCPILSDPIDSSPPGSSIHGIFQARVLEWGAIAFSVKTLFVFFFFLATSRVLRDLSSLTHTPGSENEES